MEWCSGEFFVLFLCCVSVFGCVFLLGCLRFVVFFFVFAVGFVGC